MNGEYVRCTGAELYTADGRRILDFLSGYCVHNTGHNHPRVVSALASELARCGPAMLQSQVSELAGRLAAALCRRAGGRLSKVFFCTSGSEGVEAVIKFARAHTARSGLLYASGAFHGLTCGALSLMDGTAWRDGFGPLLPGAESVPFGDLGPLRERLATRRFAVLLLEPIQGEAGVCLPAPDYLAGARALCRKYGTLFALDEAQTGLYRTGPFLAAHHYGVEPDMVVLAKALSGGLIPSAAVLMSESVFRSAYGSLPRAAVHTSTYGENSLAMRAGLATLEVLDSEGLGRRAARVGEYLRRRLTEALRGYEMVREIRGLGLLCGIEFAPPRTLALRLPYQALRKIHPGLFGQMVVMRLFRDRSVLTQACANNLQVLKVAPPLVVDVSQVDAFVTAVREVMDLVHSSGTFWSDALGLAHRALNG